MTNNLDLDELVGKTLKADRKGAGPGTGTTDNLDTSKEFTIKETGGIDGGPFSGYEDAKVEQEGEIKELHPKNLTKIVEEIV